MRFVKRVGDRGTITLPSELRDVLDIAQGDIVEFKVVRVVKRHSGASGGASSTKEGVPGEGRGLRSIVRDRRFAGDKT